MTPRNVMLKSKHSRQFIVILLSMPLLQLYAQPPNDLLLQNTTISTTTIFEARYTITAGPNLTIAATGDATFRTGGTIYFRPPVAIAQGGRFRSINDPTLLSVRTLKATVPVEFELQQNYPNPFNPSTSIQFAVKERSHVFLAVFNLLGEPVATLVDEVLPNGEYEISFLPNGLPSGVYYYTLTAAGFIQSRSMLLLK